MAGSAGATGAKGDTGTAAPAATFTIRKVTADAGKTATGQCEAGEKLVAALCSTGGSLSDDNATATCAAPADGQAPAQLALTCIK